MDPAKSTPVGLIERDLKGIQEMGFWLRRGPAVSVSFSLMRIHPAETSIGGHCREGRRDPVSFSPGSSDPAADEEVQSVSQSAFLPVSVSQSVGRSVGSTQAGRQAGRSSLHSFLRD